MAGLWRMKLILLVGSTLRLVQIDDDMLKALAGGERLKSIAIGYSCKCTREGVLALTQLTGLVELAIMGHSGVDFGVLSAEDLGHFAALKGLASLSIGVVEPAAFKVGLMHCPEKFRLCSPALT